MSLSTTVVSKNAEAQRPINNQQQQQQASSNSATKELSFKVQVPANVEYSDSVPQFPQKGRYAFPAGLLVNERASFGWTMKSNGSHSNASGNQRTRRYRCLETYFQCDQCLKIVVHDDSDEIVQQKTKKKRTSNDNNNNNDDDDDDNDDKVVENKKCIDSPQCNGVLRLKNCAVVSNLVVGPFLATLEVSGNHLHADKKQSLVEITSIRLQSVNNNNESTTQQQQQQKSTTVEEEPKRKRKEEKKSVSSAIIKPSPIISAAIKNAIDWSVESKRRAYLEAELSALDLFDDAAADDINTSSLNDKEKSIKAIRNELLFIMLALAKIQIADTPSSSQRVLSERASIFVRFPWFAALLAAVSFTVQRHKSLIFLDNDDDDAQSGQKSLIIDRLLNVSKDISMNSVLAKIDLDSSSKSNDEATLQFVVTEFAKRIAFSSQRRITIQQQLARLNNIESSSIIMNNSTTLSTNESSLIVIICQHLSKAYDDMKLFSSSMSNEFVALFLNAVQLERDRIVNALKTTPLQQPLEYSSNFSAHMSTGNVYRLSTRSSNDWLGALALACNNKVTDDHRLLELRLMALVELSDYRTFYVESIGGVKFVSDLIDDLVGNNWQTSLRRRQESLIVFANLFSISILIIDLQRNWDSIIALPLRLTLDEYDSKILFLGQSNNDNDDNDNDDDDESIHYNVIQQRNYESNQKRHRAEIATAILPSMNSGLLARRFVKMFTGSIKFEIDETRIDYPYLASIDDSDDKNLDIFQSLSKAAVDGGDDDAVNNVLFNGVGLHDLRQLLRGESLGDQIVNALIALFVRSSSTHSIECDAFSSTIMQVLKEDNNNDLLKQFKSVNGHSFQHLLKNKISFLIPWKNEKNHWSLLHIDPTKREVRHIDSLWHAKESAIPRFDLAQQLLGISQYKIVDCRSLAPQQDTETNNGVFLVLNAWIVAHRQPLSTFPYFDDDGTTMRRLLARSIINSSSSWPTL